jgi:hypothetical protein
VTSPVVTTAAAGPPASVVISYRAPPGSPVICEGKVATIVAPTARTSYEVYPVTRWSAGDGNDVLLGGSGDDVLIRGAGRDVAIGGRRSGSCASEVAACEHP